MGPAGGRAGEGQLVGGQLAVEDVALGEADYLLQVPGGDEVLVQDRFAQARHVLLEGVDDGLAEGLAFVRPGLGAALAMVGGVLHEAGDDMLARGRHGGVRE